MARRPAPAAAAPLTAAQIRDIIRKRPDAAPGDQLSDSPPASLVNFEKYREALHDAWRELDSEHADTDGWHDLTTAVCDETGIQPPVLDNTTPLDEVQYVLAAARRKERKGQTTARRSYPLSVDDWNELPDDERAEFTLPKSPAEWHDVLRYKKTKETFIRHLNDGTIPAVKLNSKRYRLLASSLDDYS